MNKLKPNVYELTFEELEFVATVLKNLNTQEGAEAYFKLEESIQNRSADNAVLYDLAAEFSWDFEWNQANIKYDGTFVIEHLKTGEVVTGCIVHREDPRCFYHADTDKIYSSIHYKMLP